MSGPVEGIGGKIPLATTFKPGQGKQQVENKATIQSQESTAQGQVNSVAETSDATKVKSILHVQREEAFSPDSGDVKDRGSLLDITV